MQIIRENPYYVSKEGNKRTDMYSILSFIAAESYDGELIEYVGYYDEATCRYSVIPRKLPADDIILCYSVDGDANESIACFEQKLEESVTCDGKVTILEVYEDYTALTKFVTES